jgi:hypothetical protein
MIYLLPLLDGLDEVEVLMQPDCVAAINAYRSVKSFRIGFARDAAKGDLSPLG